MSDRWKQRGPNPAALRLGVGYALLATLASALALALRDGVPWEHPSPWINTDPVTGMLTSALLGITLAILLIVGTRLAAARFSAVRQLEDDLRPMARALSPGEILVVAGLSSLGEELLFRGLLVPWIGILASSVVFGLVHQINAKSRWVWVGWATGVGLMLGTIFVATGSLVGPLIAHAVVNAVNLSHMRAQGDSRTA